MADSTGNYKIVEAQLPLVGGIARHDLLVLEDSNGNVIGELDGLATGANGQIKPIGYLPSDTLQVYSYGNAVYYNASGAQETIATGSESQMISLWSAAESAGTAINSENLPYPFLGLGSNSNSVASTLINSMGLTEPSIPGGASVLLGRGTLLLSPSVIQKIQSNFGINGSGASGDSLSGVTTTGGITTATVQNSDGSSTVYSFSISSSGDGLATQTGYDANNVLRYIEEIDTNANGVTSLTISGQGAVVEQNGANISGVTSGTTFTLEGAGGNADTLDLGAATDVTVLLGNATAMIDLGINNSLTVNSLNGGGTVNGATGDNATLVGSDMTVNASAGQYSLIGNGDIANVSNSNITTGAGSHITLNGQQDTLSLGDNSTVALEGLSIEGLAVGIRNSNGNISLDLGGSSLSSGEDFVLGQGFSISDTSGQIVFSGEQSGISETYTLSNGGLDLTATSADGSVSAQFGGQLSDGLAISSWIQNGTTYSGSNVAGSVAAGASASDAQVSAANLSDDAAQYGNDLNLIAAGDDTGLPSDITALVGIDSALTEDVAALNYLGERIANGFISDNWVDN